MSHPDVVISEVGPRDGLQSVSVSMATEDKKKWIAALAAAGLREIEVGSFVRADLLPQLADTHELVRYARSLPDLAVAALVPNLQGARKAMEAGVDKVTIPVSASVAHSQANVRKTPAEMVEQVRQIVAYRNEHAPRVEVEVGISTAFGCTLQGVVPAADVVRLAVDLVSAGVDSCGLSDTAGYANPRQVRTLFGLIRAEIGERTGAAHVHNTRGLGLANCLAALDAGVQTFDSSLAGLGGCPYAPGASGNVVTEDLVYMFEAMGLRTGVDFARLLEARQVLAAALPNVPLYGMTPEAGLPLGFEELRHGG